MKNIGFIIFISVFLFSCKAKKAVDSKAENDSIAVKNLPKDANKPISADLAFFENVIIPPKFEQIKINSKLKVETETSFLPTLDATIYIENNQKVWMNLSYLINVARGIATPEGIKAYNRTDKVYLDSDFDYLNNLLNTNFINYNSLQKLLMGRTFIRINDNDFLLTRNAQGYKMVSAFNQQIKSEDGTVREYKIELNYARNYDLERVYMKDVNTADELEVSYADWEAYKDFRMPKNVKIIIKGAKSSQILLENTKFDDSKMNTPFSVPGNYTKIEIR